MFLVFIGQKATTGTPNPLTGYYSIYGDYKKFRSRKDRDEFYDNWRSNNPSEQIWKCGKAAGRRFKLGISLRDYTEWLDFMPYTVKISEECDITGRIRQSWEVV